MTKKRRIDNVYYEPPKPIIKPSIKTLNDLLQLISDSGPISDIREISLLYRARHTISKINNLIGLHDVKKNILDQIICLSQDKDGKEMLNICIYSAPGFGKTTVAKLLAELYINIGLLKPKIHGDEIPNYKEPFLIGNKASMMAQYLGQTVHKTQKLIDRCVNEGKILFIDEVYSLGTPNRIDSYSKEIIDTINQNLSEQSRALICIVAGYKDQVESCFFSQNPGLRRRFPFTYELKKYSPTELCDIFKSKVQEQFGWNIDIPDLKIQNMFIEHKSCIKSGGDVENLFMKVKIAHYRRVFGCSQKRTINEQDIKDGFIAIKSMIEEENPYQNTLYG